MAKILVVEDDQGLAKGIVNALVQERNTVEHSDDGDDASARLACSEYDLVILDWSLPGKSGIDLCNEIRRARRPTPILMITGRGEFHERVEGLDSGCDDYLTKPFEVEELQARVRALLRRSGSRVHGEQLSFEDLSLDRDTFSVTRDGHSIQLLPKEFALLEAFILHPNTLMTMTSLLKHIGGGEGSGTETVRTHVSNLRKKLAGSGKESPIKTVHGQGYVLRPSKKNS